MRLLVTGGLGYVGSFAARHLAREGHEVVILDDLSTGHRAHAGGLAVVAGDCRDASTVSALLDHRRIEAVLHFAGLSEVAASVRDPAAYYAANVGGAAALLAAMREAGVQRIVFSSSAAVYGAPGQTPIPEDAPLAPVNPYGRSKAMVETILKDAAEAGQVRAACLRYFNAAGAAADGSFGEDHRPETHLIPRVLAAAREGRPFTLYGTDYPTPDGTAVRDFVHVEDLARAHAAALGALEKHPFLALNLGTGRGCSVQEVVAMAGKVTRKKIQMVSGARREGDPPILVADSRLSGSMIGWRASCSDLEEIVATSDEWYQKSKVHMAL